MTNTSSTLGGFARLAAILLVGPLLFGPLLSTLYAQQPADELNFEMPTDPNSPDMDFDFDFSDELGDGFSQFEEDGFVAADEPSTMAVIATTIAMLVLGVLMFLLVGVVAYLLSTALSAVPENFREMPPMLPWLLFIPLVNIVILILAFIKVPKSLNKYLTSIGDNSQGDCGEKLGLWGSILYILGCTFPIGLVMLVMSLMRINQAKKLAKAASGA